MQEVDCNGRPVHEFIVSDDKRGHDRPQLAKSAIGNELVLHFVRYGAGGCIEQNSGACS